MNISTLTPVAVAEDEGRPVHLKDAAGNPMYDGEGDTKTPIAPVVSGTYSTFYRAAQRKLKIKALAASGRSNNDLTDERMLATMVDEGEDHEFALEAACIRSWPFTVDDDKPYPITGRNWKALVEIEPQWRGQLRVQMHDHASFFNKA